MSSTASAKTITITDDMGNQVTVPTNVKRVVDGYTRLSMERLMGGQKGDDQKCPA